MPPKASSKATATHDAKIQTPAQIAEKAQTSRLRELAVEEGILAPDNTGRPSAKELGLSKALVKMNGKDIIRKSSSRKNRHLVIINVLLAPAAAGQLGTLAQLNTNNPVLYIEFPEGRLKLQGTLVFPRSKYLVLKLAGGAALAEDVFESLLVFSEAYWIGRQEDNPEELRLPLPEALATTKLHEPPHDFNYGAGRPEGEPAVKTKGAKAAAATTTATVAAAGIELNESQEPTQELSQRAHRQSQPRKSYVEKGSEDDDGDEDGKSDKSDEGSDPIGDGNSSDASDDPPVRSGSQAQKQAQPAMRPSKASIQPALLPLQPLPMREAGRRGSLKRSYADNGELEDRDGQEASGHDEEPGKSKRKVAQKAKPTSPAAGQARRKKVRAAKASDSEEQPESESNAEESSDDDESRPAAKRAKKASAASPGKSTLRLSKSVDAAAASSQDQRGSQCSPRKCGHGKVQSQSKAGDVIVLDSDMDSPVIKKPRRAMAGPRKAPAVISLEDSDDDKRGDQVPASKQKASPAKPRNASRAKVGAKSNTVTKDDDADGDVQGTDQDAADGGIPAPNAATRRTPGRAAAAAAKSKLGQQSTGDDSGSGGEEDDSDFDA